MSDANTRPDEADDSASPPSRQSSGLVVCAAALACLSIGVALAMFLLRRFGVIATSGGILALFAVPAVWTLCRREDAADDQPPPDIQRSLDHTWVISFWCVCTVVLLAIADLA